LPYKKQAGAAFRGTRLSGYASSHWTAAGASRSDVHGINAVEVFGCEDLGGFAAGDGAAAV
jgi:hypothetical protein